ncbi:MAG: hypothetical protein IPP74_13440 [Alphaproteobacteria bacterium]|nr:hypothetical protein [Alphaproteobacteria bacterium]
MGSLNELTEKVDHWFSGFEVEFTKKQDAFFSAHKRYWQGLSTHSEVPDQRSDRAGDTTADRLTAATTEGDKWQDFMATIGETPLAASVTCNTYKSPEGDGYEIVLFFKYEGVLYTRVINYGPERSRDKNWVIEKEGLSQEL